MDRASCLALDAADSLAPLRAQFELSEGVIYLDGNSLGALPRATPARVQQAVKQEWGEGLIRSWNTAGWIDLPRRLGDKIATLLGAGPGEVVVSDSTSVNLYKLLSAALDLARVDAPERRLIVSERDNFPTDLYIAESVARQRGLELRLVRAEDVCSTLDDTAAVLMLTHVNYRTGHMHDMASVNTAARDAGVLTVWDLAHSAGAVPLSVKVEPAADFAMGCGYKYLNGGPGAPAFAWAHPRHAERMNALRQWQPLSGWMGHAAPFDFDPHYRPAPGMARFLCGTPSVIAMSALECGVDTVLRAEPLGGMAALRRKAMALTQVFIELVESRCAGHGLSLRTPRDPRHRGSQVSYARDEVGYAIVQALIERGVVGDFRAPDLLRFGFAPLYCRHVDVWDAVEQLAQVLNSGQWREARFLRRAAVT